MENVLENLNELEIKIQEIAFVDPEKYMDFKTKIDKIKEDLTSANLMISAKQTGYLEMEIYQYLKIGDLKVNLKFDVSDKNETGEEAIKNHKVKLFIEASNTVKNSKFNSIDKIIQLRNIWNLDKQNRDYNEAQIIIVEESFANMVISYQSWYYMQNGKLPELDVSELCSLESYEHELKEQFLERVVEKNTDPETKGKMEILFSSKDLQELISDESFWKIIAKDKKVIEEVQNTALEQLERENEQAKPAEKSSAKSDDYSSPNFPRSSKVVLTLKKKDVFGQEVLVKKKIPVKNGKFMIPYDDEFRYSIIKVEIPEGVVSIDGVSDNKAKKGMSFDNCINLETVKLPSSLKKIGPGTFNNCRELREINFPENLEYIGEYAFCMCWKLREVNLPNKIEKLENGIFIGSGLTEIKLPNGLKSIGDNVFRSCYNLRELIIPNTVKTIGTEALSDLNCFEIVLPNNLERIEKGTFENSEITKMNLPDSLLYIGDEAFEYAKFSEQLIIPENVTYIGQNAFNWCSGVKIKKEKDEKIEIIEKEKEAGYKRKSTDTGDNQKNDRKLYEESIILIGPSGAGKSTVAEELRKKTGMQRLCLDEIANRARDDGVMEKFKNADEFNSYMISEILKRAKEDGLYGIVDFGAGHSVYDDGEIFEGVKSMLKPFKNIVLLIPDKDEEKSLDIMKNRSTGDTRDNKKFFESPCNKELATMVVYGNNRQPLEIAEEIMQYINERNEQQIEV